MRSANRTAAGEGKLYRRSRGNLVVLLTRQPLEGDYRDMEFDAEKIKALRSKTGWSQPRLAEELEVSQATVEKWEQGLRRPRSVAARRHLVRLWVQWMLEDRGEQKRLASNN
jgi:DNA-binding XRE family transcriptional regulator